MEISSQQFLARVGEHAACLLSRGVRRGDFVPLFLENSADFITIFLALLQIGAVPVPVKMEYRRLELDEIFANCRPEAVVTEKHHIPFLRQYLQGLTVLVREGGSLSLLQAATEGGHGTTYRRTSRP